MSTPTMTARISGISPRTLARTAGGIYVLNVVGGAFAIGFVSAAILVPGDAAATARNLLAHELLYRVGLLAHLIIVALNVPLGVILYDLLKVVNRRAALLVLFFTLVGTAIEGANLLDQFTPLVLLHSGPYSNAVGAAQLQTLAYAPLDQQAGAYVVQQVIYAGYLLSAAYLIIRSSFLPRVLGALLALGAFCYLTYSFADVLSPAVAAHLVPYIQVPSGLAELSLALWLLVVGVNVRRWREEAGAQFNR
jgi:hypothetical protein